MTLHNSIDIPSTCPACGAEYQFGFDIDEGMKVRCALKSGDILPLRTNESYEGDWQTNGLGHCVKCGAWLDAVVEFQGNVVVGLGIVTAQRLPRAFDKAAVKSRLLELLPDADIRIDQCEIVRIGWRKRLAFIHRPDDPDAWIKVAVELLFDNPDPDLSPIGPFPHIVDEACSEEEAAEKAAKWLQKVVERNI